MMFNNHNDGIIKPILDLFNPGTPGYRNTYKKTFLVTYL